MTLRVALALGGVTLLSVPAFASPIERQAQDLTVHALRHGDDVIPRLYDARGIYFSPPGRYQLSSPYHTLCGLTLTTDCAKESSFGP